MLFQESGLFTHDDFLSHRCSPLCVASQPAGYETLFEFIYLLFFGSSGGRWAEANSEQVRARCRPHMRNSQQSAVNGWTAPCLSVSLASFFFSFVASVKCKSSHLTPPQTVSHSLPSHLINHAIELNATQQKKKKKKGSWQREWRDLPSLFFFFLSSSSLSPSRRDCNFQAGSFVTVRVFRRARCFNRVHGGSSFFITTSLSACHQVRH